MISKVKNKNVETSERLPYREVWMVVSMYPRINDQGVFDAQMSISMEKTYFGHCSSPLTDITTEELNRVVAMRRRIDAWIAGEIEELPSDSIENLPWREKLDV